MFNTLVFTLLYVKIPIQQIIHVLLTVGYKFVNDLENWFSLPWLWRHQMIWVTGRKSPIYKNSMPGSKQLCIEKLWIIQCSVVQFSMMHQGTITTVLYNTSMWAFNQWILSTMATSSLSFSYFLLHCILVWLNLHLICWCIWPLSQKAKWIH